MRGGRVGDGEEVVVEDRAAGTLPVGPERVVWVCALGVGVDERRRGGVAREPELGVALYLVHELLPSGEWSDDKHTHAAKVPSFRRTRATSGQNLSQLNQWHAWARSRSSVS